MAIASSFKSLSDLAKAVKKAPRDEALALAQYRASLPIEQGGLGLPPGNTPMERAAKLFPEYAYIGSRTAFDALDPSLAKYAREGSGSWMSRDPLLANTYAGAPGGNVIPVRVNTQGFGEFNADRRNWNRLDPDEPIRHGNNTDSSSSEYAPDDEFSDTNLIANIARSNGDPGLLVNDVQDIGPYGSGRIGSPGVADNMTVFDPSRVRSRFAAFDPFLKNSADLLAGLAPYALPAAGIAGAASYSPQSEAGIAGQLAKTADLDMLKLAQKSEASGLPMARIYDATGWAKGVDDKWRFEYDDSGAIIDHAKTLKAIQDRTGIQSPVTVKSVQGMLEHPAIEDAYPSLMYGKGSPSVTYDPAMSGGQYLPGMNAIRVGGDTEPGVRSTLLHETQHAIQEREGFARGTNSKATLNRAVAGVNQWLAEREKALALGDMEDVAAIDEVLAKWKNHNPYQEYRSYAGEVEARNVQTRMGMTPDERRMRPFWQTEDVPRAQQIVRMDNSPYASLMALKRKQRLSEELTHRPRPQISAGGQAVRDMAVEMLNPASWPLLGYSRELGRPEDLKYTNGKWGY